MARKGRRRQSQTIAQEEQMNKEEAEAEEETGAKFFLSCFFTFMKK